MSRSLELTLDTERLDRVATEVLVTPFFASDRPLRGPAARADWRLCGWLSEELRAGRVVGERSEAVLLLTGGRLRARWLLALGLGARSGFSAQALREAAAEGVRRARGLGARSAAFALPAEALTGVAAETGARAFAAGAAEALAGDPAAPELRLLVEPGEARRVRAALAEGSRGLPRDLDVHLVQRAGTAALVDPEAAPAGSGALAPRPAPPPAGWLDDPGYGP